VILWIVLIAVLHPFAASLWKVTNDTPSANLPASAPSTRVVALQEQAQGGSTQTESDAVVVVFVRDSGITATDRRAVDSARSAVAGLVGHVEGLGAPGPIRSSQDGEALAFSSSVTASGQNVNGEDAAAVDAIHRSVARSTSAAAADGLSVNITGQAAVNADGGSTTQNTLLLTALLIVAVILFIVYRSLVLWLFPLLGVAAALIVAQAAAHGLASVGFTVSSLSTAILIVLVFGAASDYALLLTHRYRDELRHHEAAEDAMAAALRRTLPTLAASAATVIGAMLCLLAADSASLHGLGPVGAVSIVAALLAQATFLPALLLVAGRSAFWPRIPHFGDPGKEESKVWASVGSRVSRHPAMVAICAVIVLGVACIGLATVHTDNSPLDNLKGRPESVTAANLYAAHFGKGVIAPLVLLVPPAEVGEAAAAARATTDVATVTPAAPVERYDNLAVVMSVDPYSPSGYGVVSSLRQRLATAAPGSLVGGPAAIQYDVTQAASRDEKVLIPLVLIVIFLVIALLLQALVAPLLLVLTAALSFAASFGLSNLLWRYGLGYGGIESELPLYIFIFLVALGVDYDIFLSARIRKESRELGTREGTLRGLAVTGGVITAAGVVLAGTFAALAQRPLVDLTEVGTAVAIGVLLDTLVVRTVLVPAALLAIGERVWWPSRSSRRGNGHTGSSSVNEDESTLRSPELVGS
jgi:putative drug exporter of the RND superfamily